MSIRILVIDGSDNIIGRYRAHVRPIVGELIDTNNGTWIITQIQHDVCGSLDDETKWEDCPMQGVVVAYVRKLSADQKAESK